MRTLGNIVWHVLFLGFILSFITFIAGGLFVLSVAGAPVGLGLIQLSKFYLAPFSNEMRSKRDLNIDQNKLWKAYGIIVQILYFPIGLILAVTVITEIVGLFVSIIGIPAAIALSKSLGTCFNPVNKVCVHRTCNY